MTLDRVKLMRLADALVEDIMKMSDEEVMQVFADLVAQARSEERERCAKVADKLGTTSCQLGQTDPSTGTFECCRLECGECNCFEFDELAETIRALEDEK